MVFEIRSVFGRRGLSMGVALVMAAVTLSTVAQTTAAPPAHAAAGPTWVSGADIYTSQTWGPEGSPYVVDGSVTVRPGGRLTLLPGTVVKFFPTTERANPVGYNISTITVTGGQLDARGTPADPVIFTSYHDDSVGGDTDGAGRAPERGDWWNLRFTAPNDAAGAAMPMSLMDNVVIRYGGEGGGTTCGHGAAVDVDDRGRLLLTRAEITDSPTAGVAVDALKAGIGIARITNTRVAGSDCGAYLHGGDLWANRFDATTDRTSMWVHSPVGITMFGNWIVDSVQIAGDNPTREQANFLGNEFVGGVQDRPYPIVDHNDLRFNSWKSGNPDTLTGCYDSNQTYIPKIHGIFISGVDCSISARQFKKGYFTLVTPFSPPVEMPETGLGNYTTASEQLPQMPLGQTFGGPCNCQRNGEELQALRADPVNTATGSFTETYTDTQMSGPGVPFRLTRSYNSLDILTGPMGRGWTFAFNASLSVDPVTSHAKVRAEDGQQAIYRKNPDGTFSSPPGIVATLTKTAAGYRLTRPDETYLDFDAAGRVTAMREQTGHGLTLAYVDGKLSTITDAAGRTVGITFTGDRLTQVTLPDGRHVDYGYTDGHLTSVTDARGKTTTYAYDTNGLLASATDPNGSSLFRNTYDTRTGRMASQLDARGNQTTFEWDSTTQVATTIDPRGHRWTDAYQDNVLISRTDPLGHTTTYDYDPRLNLTATTDARGNTTTLGYDNAGNLTSRTAPAPQSYVETWTYTPFNAVETYRNGRGKTTTYAYYADTHRLKSVTDPLDRVTTYTYNQFGQLDTATDPRGKVTDFDYDAAGNLIRATTPEGGSTSFGYDAAGRRTSMVEPRGNEPGANAGDYTTSYGFNANDQLTSVTDPRNHTTTWSFDNAGNLDTVTDATSKVTEFDYYPDNRLKSATDPRGAVVEQFYDTAGNLTKTITPAGTTSYGYDSANRRTSEVTPRGNGPGATAAEFTRAYGYDPVGNLVAETHPTAGTTSYAYDELNRLTTVTDALDKVTDYGYDENSNPTTVTDALGHITRYSYDAADQLDTLTDANNKVTDYGYNATGQRTSLLTPLGNEWKWSYDGDGRLASETDPRGDANPADYTTTYAYDAAGHLTQTTRPLNRWTKYEYDRAGNLATVTDGNNHATAYSYDAMNRLASVTGPANTGTTSYGYDARSNLTTRTDAKNRTSSFTYDLAGRPTEKATQAGTWRYSYDAESNLTTEVTPAGTATPEAGDQTIRYAWDPANRLTEIDYSDTTLDVSYGYDELRLTSMTEAGAGTPETYSHDALGRLKTLTRGTTGFSYDYDALGHVTSRTHPDGTAITQTWDDDGRPTTLTSGAISATYGYDAAANLTTITRGNGVTDSLTYDNTGLVTSIEAMQGTSVVATHDYTHDNVGNPLTVHRDYGGEEPNLAVTDEAYTYDEANRLTQVCYTETCDQRSEYTYDPIGNRLTENRVGGDKTGTVTLTYNDKDQLTQTSRPTGPGGSEVIDYDYDANGNQTTAGPRTFTYDLANRPTSTTSDGVTTGYRYDGNGARLASTTGSAVTDYTWDPNYPLPELVAETTDNTSQRFINQPGGDPVGAVIPGTSGSVGPHYLHTDPLGTVQAVTDNAGARQATYAYEPFGTTRPSPTNQDNVDNPTLFAGEYQDPTTDLYHLRARDYDTTTGRFNALDPVAQDIADPYAAEYIYVNNRPTALTDPSGQCWFCGPVVRGVVTWAIAGGIAGAGIQTTLSIERGDGVPTWQALAKSFLAGALVGAVSYGGLRVCAGRLSDDIAAKTLPRSGPIPRSLSAASRPEDVARKLGMNVNSPTTRQVLNSLDDSVADFVGTYRKGSIMRELPSEILDMRVEDAIRYSSKVRKLLVDRRFAK